MVMAAVLRMALEILGSSNTQELANTEWAFAKVNMKEEQLMAAVARRAVEILELSNAQSLANAVWAFACWTWRRTR